LVITKNKYIIILSFFVSSLILGCIKLENTNNRSNDDSETLKIEGLKLVWNDEFNVDGKPDGIMMLVGLRT